MKKTRKFAIFELSEKTWKNSIRRFYVQTNWSKIQSPDENSFVRFQFFFAAKDIIIIACSPFLSLNILPAASSVLVKGAF